VARRVGMSLGFHFVADVNPLLASSFEQSEPLGSSLGAGEVPGKIKLRF
jgi:hypothetical protein